MNKKVINAINKAGKSLYESLPILLTVLLLISLLRVILPSTYFVSLFKKNTFYDAIIGATIGSISAGNAITSYIIGGELLKQGISLIAVTAFIVAWVSVGIVQLPAEIAFLGRKFAIVRNILAFISSIIIAIITVIILHALVH